MQRCTHCNAQQLDGAIFCSECGASLLGNPQRRETTASLNRAAAARGEEPASAMNEPLVIDAPAESLAPTFTLVVINSGRRITLEAGDTLLIGRKDNQRGIYPDVDLGLDGGYDAGVSRRHAMISLQNGSYCIEDLASANGTFVNGRRLPPQEPFPIRSGDELKLGTLLLRFEIG
ncbi:MAG: FHA domain-containing protein [Oscillochloridaceae bacterium]|nr:FHA domain-containing protein [Chloroflexaceae bacterium]MDW8389189.1 FHA domain-containing protein [Oscillochloridaceae bacterium]